MIITLCGPNRFQLQQRLDELVAQFASKYGDLSIERFEAENTSLDNLLASTQSLPFLAESKLVIVRDGTSNKALHENVEQIISSISPGISLIFVEPEIDRRTAFFKVLSKQTQLEEFKEIDAQGLAKWLVSEAKKQAADLSFSDANYLVQRLGESQALLASELNKLITYDPKISRSNIDLLCEKAPQSQIFDLLEAAFNGQTGKALGLYEDQRAQKVEPQVIISMIIWQLQQVATVAMAGTRQNDEIATETGLKTYPIQKARGLAQKIGLLRLKELIDQLRKIDYFSKSRPLDLDEALKTYIATL